MSTNINEQVVEKIKCNPRFALQIDESTDTTSKCQLLAFCRFFGATDVIEQFFICKELETTATGQDTFVSVSSYLSDHGLSWRNCCGICTDGAPLMIGKYKNFTTRALKENPSVIITLFFTQRSTNCKNLR